jgi:hypothetical protein
MGPLAFGPMDLVAAVGGRGRGNLLDNFFWLFGQGGVLARQQRNLRISADSPTQMCPSYQSIPKTGPNAMKPLKGAGLQPS